MSFRNDDTTMRRRRRFDDELDLDFRSRTGRSRNLEPPASRSLPAPRWEGEAFPDPDAPPEGDRWTTWQTATAGPAPRPHWVVTELGACDTELGVLKTGKEADVHLLRRAVPGEPGSLLAAKRYRTSDHRMFHRDAGYTEGRRVRRSRETRAMTRRTDFGRELLAGQWAHAEFAALSTLWQVGQSTGAVRVPYPVSVEGSEVLLEFLGTPDGAAAPRLAQLRPDRARLHDLWQQALDALVTLARHGYAHGDLSPYNLLVHDERLVLIDLPQIVDIVGNPHGPEFLGRDVRNVTTWFLAQGLTSDDVDPAALYALLLAEAGLG